MSTIPTYPNKPLALNSTQTTAIKAVQKALNDLGLSAGLQPGVFDTAMQSAIKVFQARNVDAAGHALKVDGIVGPFTWTALLGSAPLAARSWVIAPLPAQALATAIAQIGTMETPGQPNRGPQVDVFLKTAGIANPTSNPPGGYPWCQAFVYWCMVQASSALAQTCPAPKTAGVLDHWDKAKTNAAIQRITRTTALADLSLVRPGMVFINNYGNGHGHTGFVERVYPDGRLVTVEGNTNAEANAEGLGVYRLERRKLTDKELLGFLDYSAIALALP